ncbi:MAG: N-6 DNA methylase [Methylococcales bacterium]|nr:N-6 DNA methylase [Methylococcales bacterium]
MITIETLRKNATRFAKDFADASYEMGQAQSFIIELCKVFDLDYIRAVRFEDRVKKAKGKGRIDAFFPSLLLVEMKSAGKDLDEAYAQATDYFHGLNDEDLPRCVLVSDFQNLHLYNQETKDEPLKIKLAELPQHIERFRFLTGYKKIATERQERINKAAAEKMADLHDAIKATGYDGKDLENYLVRLLFCLFAEDTGLFGENGTFLHYLKTWTVADGSDLHGALNKLFDTLNTPDEKYLAEHPDYQGKKRLKNLPEHLADFPYINGALFEGGLAECYFDESSRAILIECANLDWSEISPAIFGSLFQAIMHFDDELATAKTKKRREFGAHYTSEANILKVINPLFMDDLRAEFKAIGKNYKRDLVKFHNKLAKLNFFDPACGCGNFLIIAYRELRLLELDVIKRQCGAKPTDKEIQSLILCDVDQFHGIDIDESAVHIALVAMWLTDHQVNTKVQVLGNYYNRIPLVKKANIVCANALQIDWATVIKPKECDFIMGNPPFVGYSYQTKDQKADLALVFHHMKGAGVLDLVAAWHVKAARYIQANPSVPVAFVSTNSLTQGEQVAILWTELLKLNIKLHFAHRTFQWSNEGRGVAAVHCVIMGFHCANVGATLVAEVVVADKSAPTFCRLFNYGDNIKGEPIEIKATQINPYLVDAPTVLIEKRRKPLNPNVPEMTKGSQPTDGGHLLLSQQEADSIQQNDPIAAKYIRPFLGAEEFINNLPRYCLWLTGSTTNDRLNSPEIKKRMELVKVMRLASPKVPTQKLAETPYLFGEIRQTDQLYLLIPRVSSEQRKFIPIGYFEADVICGDANFMLPNASLYDFGLLSSSFHNAWMRTVCGRLKSDYRYSNTIVYNNFPFPEKITTAAKTKIETAAQQILNARKAEETLCTEQGQKYSLATLYAAGNMPADLLKAHNALDKAVDAAYAYKGGKDDAARVAFLFEKYQQLTAPLMETEKAKKPRKIKG